MFKVFMVACFSTVIKCIFIYEKIFSYTKPHYNAVIDLLRERIMGDPQRVVSPIQVLS